MFLAISFTFQASNLKNCESFLLVWLCVMKKMLKPVFLCSLTCSTFMMASLLRFKVVGIITFHSVELSRFALSLFESGIEFSSDAETLVEYSLYLWIHRVLK